MAGESYFKVDGWDDFVKAMEEIADPTAWENSKNMLLEKMGNAVLETTIPEVPVDTSNLVGSIDVGKPQNDSIEVGTNVEYALYVNDGHVQHKRFLPASRLTVGGKTKYLKAGAKGIMLSERYVTGSHFMENGVTNANQKLQRIGGNFIKQVYEKLL